MTINERIKYIRNDFLGMSQRQFAKEIGMGQSGFSSLERGECAATDRVVKTICMAFNISETWLRSGEGDMCIQESTFSLDAYLKDRKATDLELEIVKAYFDMPPDLRRAVINHFTSRFGGRPDAPGEDGVIDAEAAYEKTLKSLRNTDSTILNTTAADSENDA